MERIRTLIVIATSIFTPQTEYYHSVESPVFKTQSTNCIASDPYFHFIDDYQLQHGESEFKLTQRGKDTIDQIRTEQTPTNFVDPKFEGQHICAGYLYELTSRIRGLTSPNYIGMLNPHTREPGDARELPYTYRYRGGKISFDLGNIIGEDIKKEPGTYRQLTTQNDLLQFFASVRKPENLFGDIGFIYTETRYLDKLGTFGNYNSHIAKNMGLTKNNITVNEGQDLQKALGCSDSAREKITPVLSYYRWTINDQEVFIDDSGQIHKKDTICFEPYTLQKDDQISYQDIVLAHYFETEKVDTLLEFVCQGDFGPINTININPKFLEKI